MSLSAQSEQNAGRETAERGDVAAPQSRFGIATIVAVAFLMQAIAWALIWVVTDVLYGFFSASDLGYYYANYVSRMAQGLVPFRDFFIEYPPLFAPLLLIPGTGVDPTTYMIRFAAVMIVVMAGACAVTALVAYGRRSIRRPIIIAGIFSLYTIVLGPIAANRYDAVVVMVLALVILLMARERWVLSAVLTGVGFALKITPAMLLPLVLLLAPRERYGRIIVGFTVAAVTPFMWVLLMGRDASANLVQMFAYHLNRPLEIESVFATPFWVWKLMGLGTVTVETGFGSQTIANTAAGLAVTLSTVALLVGLGAVFALVWRRRAAIAADASLQSLAILATILASLVGSKVLSPQYFVWMLPAVALVAIDRRVLGAVLAIVLLLTHVLFPANYYQFAQYQLDGAIALVVVRNVILVGALAMSLWYLWKIPDLPPRRAE